MKQVRVVMLLTLMVLLCGLFGQAQQSVATATDAIVPPLVNFSGVLTDANGKPSADMTGVTFYLYKDQQGGAPVWMETQSVHPNSTGHYTAMLGSTTSQGIPAGIFTTGEAHWLGVQVSGQAEQPRVLLVSAPYALKAGDAETLGGLPPSAFMLAVPQSGSPSAHPAASASGQDTPPASGPVTGTGTANYLPMWDSASDIINSALFQSGTGTTAKIGINITTPAATLDVKGTTYLRGKLTLPAAGSATAVKGGNSQPWTMAASAFDSTTATAVNQNFEWLAEPVNNNTTTPSGALHLLSGQGTGAYTETGLNIASNGQITFAAGQTFPGTGDGTITGVTAGTDLTGGGSSGNITLNLNTSATDLRYAQLGAVNTFTGNQTVNGIFSATSNAFGVVGTAKATSGIGVGVGGTASSPAGYGVEGVNTGSGGIGVYGYDNSGTGVSGYGVTGIIGSGTSFGVQGTATAAGSAGVSGTAPQFGLYGTATGSGKTVGVFGAGADGVQGSGSVYGVYAAGTGAGSTGVYGTAPQFGLYGVASGSGSTVGVYGSGADGLQGSGTTNGVYAAGGTNGVYGTAPNFGLYGVATATTGNSVGVYGTGIDGLQGTGSAYGVYAVGTGATSSGAYGTAPNFGLYGVATATTGNSVGVYGSGIDGLQGTGINYGAYSSTVAHSTTGIAGTYGVFGGPSATGPNWIATWGGNVHAAGVWADTNWDGDDNSQDEYVAALLATADADYAAVFLNNSPEAPTTYTFNYGTGPSAEALRAEGTSGSCSLTGGGDAACTGVLKSVVATTGSAGAQRVETYSMQSAENWFEDAGTAQLVNGTARVDLESVFGQTVNTGVEYHVFLTPDGDCKGLYVSAKTGSGFEVREFGGGASSIAFEYRIMAKRAGYEKVRLADVTERFNKQEAQSKKMQRPARSSAAAQPVAAQPN